MRVESVVTSLGESRGCAEQWCLFQHTAGIAVASLLMVIIVTLSLIHYDAVAQTVSVFLLSLHHSAAGNTLCQRPWCTMGVHTCNSRRKSCFYVVLTQLGLAPVSNYTCPCTDGRGWGLGNAMETEIGSVVCLGWKYYHAADCIIPLSSSSCRLLCMLYKGAVSQHLHSLYCRILTWILTACHNTRGCSSCVPSSPLQYLLSQKNYGQAGELLNACSTILEDQQGHAQDHTQLWALYLIIQVAHLLGAGQVSRRAGI